MLPWRDRIEPLTIGFSFLVVVVVAAAVGRLGPGILAALVSFLAFNFFFLPPYDTFVIARAEHVVALFVFLGLSILISLLYARAVERADAAEGKERSCGPCRSSAATSSCADPGRTPIASCSATWWSDSGSTRAPCSCTTHLRARRARRRRGRRRA